MTLTSKELKEKIERVSADLIKVSQDGNLHGIAALTSYKEYLEDELQLAEENEKKINL
jgi:hypothetical protein